MTTGSVVKGCVACLLRETSMFARHESQPPLIRLTLRPDTPDLLVEEVTRFLLVKRDVLLNWDISPLPTTLG